MMIIVFILWGHSRVQRDCAGGCCLREVPVSSGLDLAELVEDLHKGMLLVGPTGLCEVVVVVPAEERDLLLFGLVDSELHLASTARTHMNLRNSGWMIERKSRSSRSLMPSSHIFCFMTVLICIWNLALL
jgi:hypothetical protein